MGDEVLEDTMEDFYSANEAALSGKKLPFLVLMIGVTVSSLVIGNTDLKLPVQFLQLLTLWFTLHLRILRK